MAEGYDYKRVLRFLLISSSHYHYEMKFDEGYGGTISQPVWMSLVHCVRSFYGVFGAIDFDEFSTLVVKRIVGAVFRTEDFVSRRGVDPWLELRKRRRMDLFDGKINHLFPLAPVVDGVNSSASAFQRVAAFLDSCNRARRGRGADEERHDNSGSRRSARVRVPQRTLNEIAPQVYTHWPMACERRRSGEAAEEEMDTSTHVSEM